MSSTCDTRPPSVANGMSLFERYLSDPQEMPASYAQRSDRERAVADYIAGMTDRFASREHHRLTGLEPPHAA